MNKSSNSGIVKADTVAGGNKSERNEKDYSGKLGWNKDFSKSEGGRPSRMGKVEQAQQKKQYTPNTKRVHRSGFSAEKG